MDVHVHMHGCAHAWLRTCMVVHMHGCAHVADKSYNL